MKFTNEKSCGSAFAWVMSAKTDKERERRYKSLIWKIIDSNIFELNNLRKYFTDYQPFHEFNDCCVHCRFCYMGCSWSDCGIPVKDGKFLPSKRKNKMQDAECFNIFYCPKREIGEPIHSNKRLSVAAIDAVNEMREAYNRLKICRTDFENHPEFPSTRQAYIEAARAMVDAEAFFSDLPLTLAEARKQIGYEPNKLDDMILERMERES